MKRWIFDIPHSLNEVVGQKISPEDVKGKENPYDDYELRVAFCQEDGTVRAVRSMFPIANCLKFRYFEVEVIENKSNADIFFGIIDGRETFSNFPESV